MAIKLTKDQLNILHLITKGSGAIGIIGSLAFFYLFLQSPKHLHSPNARLVFALGLVDFWDAVFKFLGRWAAANGASSFGCHLQAVLLQICDGTGIALTICLGYNVFYLIYMRGDPEVVRKREMLTLIFSLLIPTVIAFTPYWIQGDDFYGDSDLWCWIANPYGPWRLYMLYVPAWIVFFFCVGVLLMIVRRLTQWQKQLHASGIKDKHIVLNREFVIELEELIGYLITFLILWIPSSINRIKYVASGGDQIFLLYALQAATSPTHGFANFVPFLISWMQMKRLDEEQAKKHSISPPRKSHHKAIEHLKVPTYLGRVGSIQDNSTYRRSALLSWGPAALRHAYN